MPLPEHAQKNIYDGDEPIACSDFCYETEKICVFVDGPDHDHSSESDIKNEAVLSHSDTGYSL